MTDRLVLVKMKIEFIVCPDSIEDKLESKHDLTAREARQVLLGEPRIRFAEKGHRPDENVYAAFGQTRGGRYVAVFFVHKPQVATAIIISARDMTAKERKQYARR